jgi:hypothetical protein
LKDCLASVVEIAKPPSRRNDYEETQNIVPFSRRFGGVSYKS